MEREKKDKSITFRLSEVDLLGLKAEAAKVDMKYQSFLTRAIRQINSGEIKVTV